MLERDTGCPGPQSNGYPREPVKWDRLHPRVRPGPPVGQPASSTKPKHPSPQSQSLSQSYGSNLPTSLTYIVLSTRGCAPWRPAADMGTGWHENHTVSVGFSRADESAPDTARAAVLYGNPFSLSPGKPIPGIRSLTKKRELFPGPSPTSPTSFALPHMTREGQSPCPGSGILTRFPFDRRRATRKTKIFGIAPASERSSPIS